jgi:D-xylose transport system substrate-binding protein
VRFKIQRVVLAMSVLALAIAVAACGDDNESTGGGGGGAEKKAGKVAVLLPDSKSSVRWETVDRPFLKKAFDAAGVEAEIQNAEGDKSTQQQQA